MTRASARIPRSGSRAAAFSLLACAAFLAGACSSTQSVLAPHGPNAERVATLGWIMFAGAALIFVAVMALAFYAIYAAPPGRRRLATRWLIIGGGIVFPVVTLSALLGYGLWVSVRTVERAEPAAERVQVIGEQWWWRVRYLDEAGEAAFITANEIRIPVGRAVELELLTADVIHSFWVPNLAGKLDMVPGHVNRMRLRADAPGVFRGQCAEYCGGAHARMAFYVVAQTPDDFAAWRERQQQPAAPPDTPLRERGRELFLASGCGGCHTIRGTPATGTIGPDLTHVGSRLSIGAGMLPNNAGTLAGWIADSQTLKPDNHMPSFGIFDGVSLRALAAYLESLK